MWLLGDHCPQGAIPYPSSQDASQVDVVISDSCADVVCPGDDEGGANN